MVPGVVFDLDGTLVHSAPDLHSAANKMLNECNLPSVTLPQVTTFVGDGVPKLVERCLALAGGTNTPFELALERFHVHYLANPFTLTRPYNGVATALEVLLSAGVKLGVCTNKPLGMTQAVLDGLSLTKYFGVVVGGDTLAVRKPAAEPLLLALEQLGVERTPSLYVGDSEVDAETATAAGVDFALYSNGYRKSPIEAMKADFVFNDYPKLTDFILART